MNLIQRIAYRYLFAEESPPLHWDEFLNAKYEGGSKRVPNTNPKTKKRFPEVTMQTLFNSDEAFKKRVMEEYAEWVKKRDEKPESKSDGVVKELSFSRRDYKPPSHISEYLQFYFPDVEEEDAAFLIGLPFLSNPRSAGVGLGDSNVEELVRTIEDGEDGPYLNMDCMLISPDAPAGLGTRLFTSSVYAAQKLGMPIWCKAQRGDPFWIGYKVWPKMGYDGEIPEGVEITSEIEERLEEAGFEKPYRVSHLYKIEGGQEFWEEHGDSFYAEFDTTPGSQSMRVLEAYLRKRMEREGYSSLEEWMYAGMDDGKKASLMRVAMRYLIRHRYYFNTASSVLREMGHEASLR